MAKTFSQIRLMLNEVQGPDPKPAMPKGPNGHSNVVREEDEVDESHIPVKPPAVAGNQGDLPERVGRQKVGNQNRKPSTYAEEALEEVKKKIMKQNGRTNTGGQAETITSEPIIPSLTGYH